MLIGTLYFTSPNGDGTAILRGHPSHAKFQPPPGQRKNLHFSVIFKTLSIGPAAGIEPATSRSAVKRSTDWANPAAGGKRSRKSCFPARVGCLAWKLERFYSLSGILHQGAPEPRIAFLPSLVSAWETFHVKNYAPRALALSAWHEREPADRKQNIQRRAWKSKWGWQLSIFVQFPAQSTCPLEAIIMADKADSQDLKSKAKEITKVSRNHYESLK